MRPGFSDVFSYDEGPTGAGPSGRLAADAELLDDDAIAGNVGLDQILEKATTLSHEEQQATTTVVVMLVGLQVLREVADPTREHRDLNLRAAGVSGLGAVFGDDLLLSGSVERHAVSSRARLGYP